jgi:hypothetical protein
MLRTPLLSLLPNAIIQNQNALAMHTVDHGFEYSRTSLNAIYPGDLFQRLTQAFARRLGQLFFIQLNKVTGMFRMISVMVLYYHLLQLLNYFFQVDQSAYRPHDLQFKLHIMIAQVLHLYPVLARTKTLKTEITGSVSCLPDALRVQHNRRPGDGTVRFIKNLPGERNRTFTL